MKLSGDERLALGLILGLLLVASAARWLERPRTLLLDDVPALDVAALETASVAARPAPRAARAAAGSGTVAGTGAAAAAGSRVDPNTAGPDELRRLPGIGPAMAERIMAERQVRPFSSMADLQRVRGIGPALAAALADHVALSGAAAPAAQPAGDGGLDLNRATAAELQVLPGVGPVLAARLVSRRDSLGRYRDWADVDAVAGVGPAMLERLKEQAAIRP